MKLLIFTCLVVVATCYEMVPPTISLLKPQGLRMAIPDEPGITLFAVHYSINKPVPGVAAGDYNYDITTKTGNEWVHENTAVIVNVGDTVYYWTHVDHSGSGYDLTDQSWVAVDDTSSTTTTSTTTSTITTARTTSSSSTTTSTGGGQSSSTTPSTEEPPANECTSYPCLIFEDNFDSLDFNKWKHEITLGGGGNWEFEYYVNNRSNSYTKDGNLYIKPTLTSDKYGEALLSSGTVDLWGAHPGNLCTGNAFYGCFRQGTGTNYINPIQSARLRTAETFSFKYGRIEVRAQMPKGDWIWPAIWLLPVNEAYGNWPASGEIDLLECRGNADLRDAQGQARGNTYGGTTMHWGPYWPYNKYYLTSNWKNDNFADTFHTYALEWSTTGIVVWFDGVELMRVEPGAGGFWEYGGLNNELPSQNNPWQYATPMAPFDEDFYIIMNVAVGGTNGYFDDSWTNAGYPKPWSNTSPTAPREFWLAKNNWYPTWNPTANNGEDAAMKVDYVRIWKLSA